MKLWTHTLVLSTALASMVGCGFSTSDDLGTWRESSALRTVPAAQWESGLAGCESLLSEALEYGVASGEPELLVAFDADSHVLCVDSYANIEEELLEFSPDQVDALWLGYVSTLQSLESREDRSDSSEEHATTVIATQAIELELEICVDCFAADPDPQPASPIDVIETDADCAEADPDPQPAAPPADPSDPEGPGAITTGAAPR